MSEKKPFMKVEGEWNGVMNLKYPVEVSYQLVLSLLKVTLSLSLS